MAEPDPFYNDVAFTKFYDLACGSERKDFDYCSELARQATSVLDLGCGTGEFLASLQTNGTRTGADPAGAMLEFARNRPGGKQIQWVEEDAPTLRLDRTFDLIVLTGHAFQVFLTDDDRRQVLQTIAFHLSPTGRFIFDTRNPLVREWEQWVPERSRRWIHHPEHGPVETWNDVVEDPNIGIVTYHTFYRIERTGAEISSQSQIAFPHKEALARMIGEAGLDVETWLGNWSGQPYTPNMPEIIPLGRLN